MPQLQNVVLTDRATTPVNHTFTPMGINVTPTGNVGVVVETTGTPIGEPKLSISMRRVNDKLKGKLVLTIPQVQTETVNGVSRPVVVRSAALDLELTFSSSSSQEERNNAIGMLASALDPSKVLVNDAFVKAQGIY